MYYIFNFKKKLSTPGAMPHSLPSLETTLENPGYVPDGALMVGT